MNEVEITTENQNFLGLLAELERICLHDPGRYETTDGLDNPDCTNGDRASMALEALDCFQEACNMVEDVDTAASDLICNLLHLVHSRGFDPRLMLQNGLGAFLCESGNFDDTTNEE